MADEDLTDATIAAERVATPLSPGSTFADRYRIDRMLGEGGMGAVFAATDESLGEPVALKVLRSASGLSADTIDRFRREVRLARRVTHVNVARTFDIGQIGDEHYLTMELVPGRNLGEYLAAHGPLPASEVVEIGRQLCAGLAAAHAAGVVHRDLKPPNILRADDGRIVITDFGIARGTVDERDRTLGDGQLIGTPAYMAPEQVEGGEITARTDLYALGLILFELVSGQPAFSGDTAIALAMARLRQPAPTLTDVAGVDAGLSRVVASCLQRRVADRPASASEVGEALAALQPVDARVARPVATLVGAMATQSGSLSPHFATLDTGDTSVAVLPLRYRGPADDAYLAEVLTDELVDLLSMTRGLRVPSAGATARFAEDRDPKVVGEALGVDAIIDGSLQRMGPRVRVTVRLVKTATGVQTFSEHVDGTLQDVFELQDRVAKRVAEALRLRLQVPTFGAIAASAAEHYLRARQAAKDYEVGGQGPTGAIAHYEACLAEAPQFGPAIAGHALACARLWFFHASGSTAERDWPEQTRASVARALALAPRLPESHLAAARMHVQQSEYPEAARALQAALQAAPTCGPAHAYLGMLQCEAGRGKEGVEHILLGVELDPGEVSALIAAARYFALRGDYERWNELLTRVEQEATGVARPVAFTRVRIAAWRGDLDYVRRARERLGASSDIAATWAGAISGAYLGEVDAEQLEAALHHELGNLGGQRMFSLMRQLCTEALASSGDVEGALAQLAAARDVGLVDVEWLDRCPLLDSVRSSDGFAPIRAEVKARAEAIWRAG